MGSQIKPDNFSGFDHGLLDSILNLMVTDSKFIREYQEYLKPELFADDIRIRLADAALRFYLNSGCAAKNLFLDHIDSIAEQESFSEARLQLLKDKAADVMQASPNVKYVSDRLDTFFEFQKVKILRYELERAFEDGDIQSAVDAVKKAKIGVKKGDKLPVDYFGTLDSRINRRFVIQAQEDGVNFMIPSLTRYGIFAHRREITLCIAPSKRGKSIFLTHCGKAALLQGHGVLHVSLENPIEMVEDRYDAMLSGLETEYLRTMADKLRVRIEYIRDIIKGKLYIIWRMAKTYSPYDLANDVQMLRAEGKRIDVALVDYGELMKPMIRGGGESFMRAARDDIFANLRSVANESNLTLITAQQTPLKKRKQFRVYMEDGQESSMPAQHSSLIITLNQTPEEEKANEMRLYVDGYWHGISGTRVGDILVKQDFNKMNFCVREIPVEQGVAAPKQQATP